MQPLKTSEIDKLPNIYYIIPDMFARTDAIQVETGFDNASFINQLKELGFYVAECSRSNYASTQLSIATSLNMNYLDQIQEGMTSRPMLVTPINESLVRKSLEQIGYQTVVFDNGFGLPEIRNANVTITTGRVFFLLEKINPFENLIVSNSILRILYDVNLGTFSDLYDKVFFPYWQHVETQKNIFAQLPNVGGTDNPQFIFAHIMMPHPPYLIHEDGVIETDSSYYREALGQPVSDQLYREGYLMQVQYVQGQLLKVVNEILENSETEPIIIIQGDHGIQGDTRLDILNAYYVPESIEQYLYPSITPINSFRVIFNQLFETDYALLPDVSWYSVYPDWFELEIDNEKNPACIIDP